MYEDDESSEVACAYHEGPIWPRLPEIATHANLPDPAGTSSDESMLWHMLGATLKGGRRGAETLC